MSEGGKMGEKSCPRGLKLAKKLSKKCQEGSKISAKLSEGSKEKKL